MAKTVMNTADVASAKLAECFCTIDGIRYSMLNAKSFEAKASIDNADIPLLGTMIKGKKPNGLEISITMTVYKVSEMFDTMIEQFKNTGVLPTFDIQVTSEDPATGIGKSTKIYNNCVLDGDVLLSMYDADGDFIEQEISAFAMDYTSADKYVTPKYM